MRALLTILALLTLHSAAYAKLNVITSLHYMADIAKRIGGDRISVEALAPGNWDPHHVLPKPSFISKAGRADLLIINGAGLEDCWMLPIIRDSNNPEIQHGRNGFLDLSEYVKKIQIVDNVSRSQGDVHPSGNPHYILDPHNVPVIAKVIAERLCVLDASNENYYLANLKRFTDDWSGRASEWARIMKGLKGTRVVQYHSLFDYFFKRFDMSVSGEIEPLPGIPPSSGHMEKLIIKVNKEGVKYIIQDVYHSSGPAELLARKTGARLIILPHDVSAVPGAEDIFSLFDEIVRRLAK
jgi:zinc/manganese transport system substrate-binding protein